MRTIIHLDLDAFFCTVEQQRDPALRGKPFAVGGRPESRGVVSSASYAARQIGVHSAMPMSQAARLCRDLIVVPPKQFTEATLAGLRPVLVERLDHGLGIAEIRRQVGKVAAGATRMHKPETERRPVLHQWTMTIADVYLPDLPQGAAERVRAWAAVIRRAIASV